MTIIASIDGAARRIYLHADTVGVPFVPMDAYKEMRTLRRTNESLRKYDLFMSASGNEPKAAGKFTERIVKMLQGTRFVPFDTDHTLSVTGTVITDTGQEGVDSFDRALLTPSTVVDIDYQPLQVEVIVVQVGGSALTQAEKDRLERVEKFLRNRQYTNPATGKLEQYDDSNTAVEFEAEIFADDGVTPYDGTGKIERRNRFETP